MPLCIASKCWHLGLHSEGVGVDEQRPICEASRATQSVSSLVKESKHEHKFKHMCFKCDHEESDTLLNLAEEDASIVIRVLIINIRNLNRMELMVQVNSHTHEKQQNTNHN